jgi:drug/metabolite transporter (DMT)-like permease
VSMWIDPNNKAHLKFYAVAFPVAGVAFLVLSGGNTRSVELWLGSFLLVGGLFSWYCLRCATRK